MKNKWLGYLILSPFILVAFVVMMTADILNIGFEDAF